MKYLPMPNFVIELMYSYYSSRFFRVCSKSNECRYHLTNGKMTCYQHCELVRTYLHRMTIIRSWVGRAIYNHVIFNINQITAFINHSVLKKDYLWRDK